LFASTCRRDTKRAEANIDVYQTTVEQRAKYSKLLPFVSILPTARSPHRRSERCSWDRCLLEQGLHVRELAGKARWLCMNRDQPVVFRKRQRIEQPSSAVGKPGVKPDAPAAPADGGQKRRVSSRIHR
jgi:hypothetical protein